MGWPFGHSSNKKSKKTELHLHTFVRNLMILLSSMLFGSSACKKPFKLRKPFDRNKWLLQVFLRYEVCCNRLITFCTKCIILLCYVMTFIFVQVILLSLFIFPGLKYFFNFIFSIWTFSPQCNFKVATTPHLHSSRSFFLF